MSNRSKSSNAVNRRTLLKGAAGAVGLAAGSGAITRFPYVHSAEPKVLRYLGTAVNQSADIAKKAKEDTGITIEYIPVTTDEVTKRVITQPNSFDLIDERLSPADDRFSLLLADRHDHHAIGAHPVHEHERPPRTANVAVGQAGAVEHEMRIRLGA